MLPVISYDTLEIEIPGLKKIHNFCRMNGFHEELLLQAKEENNEEDHYSAIKQVVKSCGNDINMKDLSIIDLEWIFLKLRQNSVEDIASISVLDKEENLYYPITVKLEEVIIKYPEKVSEIIEVEHASPKTIFTMKYPSADLYVKSIMKPDSSKNNTDIIISKCIDKISIAEQIFPASTLSDEELKSFVKNLTMSVRNKAIEFIMSSPTLYYEAKYTNKKNEEKKIILSTLEDFFSF